MENDCEEHYYQKAGGQVIAEVGDLRAGMDH
jgi:hypothetical protein